VIATALLVVNTNPHPLGRFRAIGPASNLQEFARAFACKPGDSYDGELPVSTT
jgi:putative endopeptidase